MKSTNKFLKLITNGWKGNIEFLKTKKTKKTKNLGFGSTLFLITFLGEINGALASYYLNGEKLPEKINVYFKIVDNGILIQQDNNKNNQMLLYWKNILGIYKSNTGIGGEVLIKLTDDTKIILSAPFKQGFFSNEYFIDEFVNYVNNYIH